MSKRNKLALFLGATLITGLLLVVVSLQMLSWRDPQVDHYNQGIALMKEGDFEQAVIEFDQSVASYHEAGERNWLEERIYPERSLELAARAYFYKGFALLMLERTQEAVQAWQDSTRLNPGNDWSNLGVDVDEIQGLELVAMWVKYDLEWLFHQNSSQSQQPQPGQEGGQEGQPSQEWSDQQLPGTVPGQPGQPGQEDL